MKITFVLITLFFISIASDGFTGVRVTRAMNRKDYLLQAKVVPPATRTADSDMGWQSAISEDESTLAAGAPIDGYDVSNANYLHASGSVSIYVKSGSVWSFQQKITAPTRHAEANFGSALAISGDTLVVGAYGETLDEANANSLTDAGAAYVYTRSGATWTFQKKLVGTGTNGRLANDQFGVSVGISSGTIVVGVWYQDFDAAGGGGYVNAAGAVFIYTGSGSTWTLQQRVVADPATGGRVAESRFGNSVSIDANTILVGSINHTLDATGANSLSDAGAAYVLSRTAGVWTQQGKLVGTGTNGRNASDQFGQSVSVNGNTAVVGAHTQDYGPSGQNNLSNAGAAYVFFRSGTTWSFQQKLTGIGTNGRVANDLFGVNVAVNADTIAVGAIYQAYDSLGANGSANAGAAYVFYRKDKTWSIQKKLVATGTNARNSGDEFGSAVSVVGNTIAVGARLQDYDENGANSVANSGAVFIFARKLP